MVWIPTRDNCSQWSGDDRHSTEKDEEKGRGGSRDQGIDKIEIK